MRFWIYEYITWNEDTGIRNETEPHKCFEYVVDHILLGDFRNCPCIKATHERKLSEKDK